MNEVSKLLHDASSGLESATEQLLPLVYDELRRLAAQQLTREQPGHSLQPTALVHEAYLRLVGTGEPTHWNSRGHFFAAAAQAMRRILVDNSRRRRRHKRGGNRKRVELIDVAVSDDERALDLLALDEALGQLAAEDPQKAQLIELRYFAGLSLEEAAECLGISRATASRAWTYARAWLYERLRDASGE